MQEDGAVSRTSYTSKLVYSKPPNTKMWQRLFGKSTAKQKPPPKPELSKREQLMRQFDARVADVSALEALEEYRQPYIPPNATEEQRTWIQYTHHVKQQYAYSLMVDDITECIAQAELLDKQMVAKSKKLHKALKTRIRTTNKGGGGYQDKIHGDLDKLCEIEDMQFDALNDQESFVNRIHTFFSERDLRGPAESALYPPCAQNVPPLPPAAALQEGQDQSCVNYQVNNGKIVAKFPTTGEIGYYYDSEQNRHECIGENVRYGLGVHTKPSSVNVYNKSVTFGDQPADGQLPQSRRRRAEDESEQDEREEEDLRPPEVFFTTHGVKKPGILKSPQSPRRTTGGERKTARIDPDEPTTGIVRGYDT